MCVTCGETRRDRPLWMREVLYLYLYLGRHLVSRLLLACTCPPGAVFLIALQTAGVTRRPRLHHLPNARPNLGTSVPAHLPPFVRYHPTSLPPISPVLPADRVRRLCPPSTFTTVGAVAAASTFFLLNPPSSLLPADRLPPRQRFPSQDRQLHPTRVSIRQTRLPEHHLPGRLPSPDLPRRLLESVPE